MTLKIESTQTKILSTAFAEPKQVSVSKDDEIVQLFASKTPEIVLNELHKKGFEGIDECRCIPQFSREKDIPIGNPDVRELIEKELPDLISKKMTKKDQPLTVCSISPGHAFEDLVMLSKISDKGYKNISWILIDPFYTKDTTYSSKELGQKILAQFKTLAQCISPGIKTQTLDSTLEIPTAKLIGKPDVILDFDDGCMDQDSFDDYQALLKPLEDYIRTSKKPVIYLHSYKELAGFSFNKQKQCIFEDMNAQVTLSYNSPDQIAPEARTLVDSTIPGHKHTPDLMSYSFFLKNNDYEGVKFCLEKGVSPNLRDEYHSTVLMQAALNGRLNAMKALVEIGHADVNATDHKGFSALHLAVSSDSPEETITYLVNHGANINIRDDKDGTPLFHAICKGDIRAIRTLVKLRADLNITNRTGHTPLGAFQKWNKRRPTLFDPRTIPEIRSLLTPKTEPFKLGKRHWETSNFGKRVRPRS